MQKLFLTTTICFSLFAGLASAPGYQTPCNPNTQNFTQNSYYHSDAQVQLEALEDIKKTNGKNLTAIFMRYINEVKKEED